jgi:hypothetical protein
MCDRIPACVPKGQKVTCNLAHTLRSTRPRLGCQVHGRGGGAGGLLLGNPWRRSWPAQHRWCGRPLLGRALQQRPSRSAHHGRLASGYGRPHELGLRPMGGGFWPARQRRSRLVRRGDLGHHSLGACTAQTSRLQNIADQGIEFPLGPVAAPQTFFQASERKAAQAKAVVRCMQFSDQPFVALGAVSSRCIVRLFCCLSASWHLSLALLRSSSVSVR